MRLCGVRGDGGGNVPGVSADLFGSEAQAEGFEVAEIARAAGKEGPAAGSFDNGRE